MVSLALLSLAALGFASPGDPDPLLLAWPGATVRGAWQDTGPRADAGASAISSAAPDGEGRELITLTCLECHEGDRPEGGLDLAADEQGHRSLDVVPDVGVLPHAPRDRLVVLP